LGLGLGLGWVGVGVFILFLPFCLNINQKFTEFIQKVYFEVKNKKESEQSIISRISQVQKNKYLRIVNLFQYTLSSLSYSILFILYLISSFLNLYF
jgi:hypothetical protein